MVENPKPNSIDLEALLRSAGQSFSDAQKALTPSPDISVNMMLSNADLELKVAATYDEQGKITVMPISSQDILQRNIDPGMLSTVKFSFVGSITENKLIQVATGTGTVTAAGNTVPNLLGKTLDVAVEFLKSNGWQYEPHAAGREDLATVEKESRGKVIRQQPSAGQSVDRSKTVIHFWADLGTSAVTDIDGIGDKYRDNLEKIGITTVGELSLASSTQIASALRISETRAQGFLVMADVMSRLAVLDFKDEVVELLVKGANVRSIEQLANAEPETLFNACQQAVSSRKVRIPREFKYTMDDVRGWIKTARSYLGK